jgi:hypothetical protein
VICWNLLLMVGVDLGRHECLKNRLLLLIFSFDLPAVRRKPYEAGRVGVAGDAVNPSLEA